MRNATTRTTQQTADLPRRRPAFVVLIGAALIGTSACSEGGGPAGPEPGSSFDAAATEANVQSVQEVLQSEAWKSFRVLGERVGGDPGGPAFAVASGGLLEDVIGLTGDAGPRSVARARDLMAAAGVSAASIPRIPSELRGLTFVLDPETMEYVVDPERPGAPANGIRYILYAVNPFTGEPVPTAEVGHADLTDEGDALPNGVSLRLQVVSEGTTFLDYAATATGTESGGTLGVEGFVRNGEERLDFEIGIQASGSGSEESVEVVFHLANEAAGFSADGLVTNLGGAGGAGRIELTVRIGDDTIAFVAEGTEDSIDATVTVNGRLFARLTGDPENPDVRGEGGRALTAEEVRALQGIAHLTAAVFELFEGLLAPAGALLAL